MDIFLKGENVIKSNNLSDYNKRLEHVRKEKASHKGEWLTLEVANEYLLKARTLPSQSPLDIGDRRKLRIELQERYGLLEIEATNILNGFGISDYVNKYYCIKNEIVSPVIENSDFQIWLTNEIAKQDSTYSKDDGWSIKDD